MAKENSPLWPEGAGFSWLNHKGRIKPGKFRIQCLKDEPVPLLRNKQTKLLKSGKQEGNYSFSPRNAKTPHTASKL